jgi:hypothetical protein
MILSQSCKPLAAPVFMVVLLAGCGGLMQAPVAQMSTQAKSSQVALPTVTCGIKNYYHFAGSCVSGQLSPDGTKFKLATYRKIGATFKLPPYLGSKEYTFTFTDATGKGDIGKFHGRNFPLYPYPCGTSSCPGTAFLYVGIKISGPGPLQAEPNIFAYRNQTGFPGTSCGEAELTGGKWRTFGSPAAPKGDRLTFDSAIDYRMGAVAVAVYCQ